MSAVIIFCALINQLQAQTSSLYDFNTPGELAENFNQTSNSTNISQSTNTGIGGTGAINVTNGSTNDVFTTQEGYSLGVTGSEYVFESYIKSVWNSGYSGLGFTNNSPAIASGSFPYRPNIGLGISVHGGGYVFHNNGENIFGSWASGEPAGVTVVKHAAIFDLLNNGSPDDWYRVVFTINRVSPTTYDMRVEIWPAYTDGTLIYPDEANAIMEMNGIENADITDSDILYSYFSFSGSRVSDFDNYSINLAGGATVVEAGAPVVFTNSSSFDNNVITVNGNAANDNGSAITDRGIVYATTNDPDLNDNVVQAGSDVGEFTASTPSLGEGTYYVRTYAVNEVGTSYGSEVTYTVEAPEVPGCTDAEACNFNSDATTDDDSCSYPEENYLDCEGNCLNDADEDGVCDEIEVPGCTDEAACNFVAEATDDDDSCSYPEFTLNLTQPDCENATGSASIDIPLGDAPTPVDYFPANEPYVMGYGLNDFVELSIGNEWFFLESWFDYHNVVDYQPVTINPGEPLAIEFWYPFFGSQEVGIGIDIDGDGHFYGPDEVLLYDWGIPYYTFVDIPENLSPGDYNLRILVGDFVDYQLEYVDYYDDGLSADFLVQVEDEEPQPLYQVEWSDGSTANTFGDLEPGTYSVTVFNDQCTTTESFEISAPLEGCTDESACNFNPEAACDDNSCEYAAQGFDCEGNCLHQAVDTDALTSTLWLYSQVNCETQELIESTMLWTFDDQGLIYLIFENEEPINIGGYATDGCTIDLLDAVGENNVIYQNGNLFWDNTDNSGNCYLWTPVPEGCTDETACNFDPEADFDDGSCTYPTEDYLDCEGNCLNDADEDGVCDEIEIPGCTDEAACNFVAEATDDDDSCAYPTEDYLDCEGNCLNDADEDGVCDEIEVPGCTDESACNFVAEATDDDDSCAYPTEDYLDCEGNCINDADEDGVCDEIEIPGCTDEAACNFVAEATDDDDSCTYPAEDYLDCEGNCLNDADNDGVCDEIEVPGCTDEAACNFVAEATDDDDSCTYPTEDYLDCEGNCINDADEDGVCDEIEIPGCTDEAACNFVAEATDDDDSCTYPTEDYLDCEGNCINDADEDGVCDEIEIPGCTDEAACNFVAEATDDNGTCFYAEPGFDCEGNCLSAGIDNATIVNTFWEIGVADCETGEFIMEDGNVVIDFLPSGYYEVIYINEGESEFGEWSTNGCTITFDGYFVMTGDSNAFFGSDIECIAMIPLASGCTDPIACNFDPEAEYDDDSCYYTVDTYYDCDGVCLNDADEDGVCDELEIQGCTDVTACNFVAEATDDDNSCEYADDFFDCEGNCLNDADGDGVCDELEVEGCTDENACNYDPEASEDDGSCFTPVEGNIAGSVQVLAFATESYTYPSTGEYEVVWTVDNGTILSGQGTAVIEVIWDEGFSGYVRAYELLGDCEGPEAELRVTIFGTVHVDEMSDASLSVYPNPSNGWVTVDAENLTAPAQLEVLDASGRLVHQQTVNRHCRIAARSPGRW